MNHLQIKEAQQKAQTYYHRIGFKLLLKTESAKNFLLNWKIIFIISFQRLKVLRQLEGWITPH